MQDNNTPEISVNGPSKAKTVIFYYTGTGNSLWIARTLAQEFGNTELISMTDRDINPDKPKRVMSEEHKQKLQQKLQEARLKSKE